MKYIVRVTERLAHMMIVEADNIRDAEDEVNKAYNNGQIVLDYDDFAGYDIEGIREANDFDNYEIDALREATDSDIKYCDILEVEE